MHSNPAILLSGYDGRDQLKCGSHTGYTVQFTCADFRGPGRTGYSHIGRKGASSIIIPTGEHCICRGSPAAGESNNSTLSRGRISAPGHYRSSSKLKIRPCAPWRHPDLTTMPKIHGSSGHFRIIGRNLSSNRAFGLARASTTMARSKHRIYHNCCNNKPSHAILLYSTSRPQQQHTPKSLQLLSQHAKDRTHKHLFCRLRSRFNPHVILAIASL